MGLKSSFSQCAAIFCAAVIFLVEYTPTASAEAHCVWYGVCKVKSSMKKYNCHYDGPARPVEPNALPILKKYCPDIAAGGVSCCNVEQLGDFDRNIGLAQNVIGSCRPCWENFLKHVCAMTCSPTQSDFLNPIKITRYNDTHKNVKELDYHLGSSYMKGTYKSCSQAKLPLLGTPVLDLMCGEYGASECSPQRWFSSMGDSSSPFVPFQINYKSGDESVDGFTPYNPPINTKSC